MLRNSVLSLNRVRRATRKNISGGKSNLMEYVEMGGGAVDDKSVSGRVLGVSGIGGVGKIKRDLSFLENSTEPQLLKLTESSGEKCVLTRGVALAHLSRFSQDKQLTLLALKYATEAVELLEGEDRGHYDQALLQRAHVYLVLGRKKEANEDERILEESPLVVTRETLKVFRIMQGKQVSSVDEGKVLSIWKRKYEYWKFKPPAVVLGDLEKKFLCFLLISPKTKSELIELLYGNAVAFEYLDNRLKNLIGRVRKKLPEAILFRDGKYVVVDKERVFVLCGIFQ